METLQNELLKNHSKKRKGELIELLTGLQTAIGKENYNGVSGIRPTELENLTKNEILEIVKEFSENYDSNWEKKLSATPTSVLKMIFGQMEADDNSFRGMAASDADFAAELGSIEFDKLIGGPLNACVTAQNNASIATVSFIKEVGFDDAGELRMVDFTHDKTTANPNLGKDPADVPPGTDVTSPTITEKVLLKVPFVSVLNIPSMRIENCTIDFNVKLNSVFTRDVSTDLGIDAEVSGGFGPVKFKVSASYKRSSSTGVKVEKEYTMGVKVVATNDEMPGGLERVLGILSE